MGETVVLPHKICDDHTSLNYVFVYCINFLEQRKSVAIFH